MRCEGILGGRTGVMGESTHETMIPRRVHTSRGITEASGTHQASAGVDQQIKVLFDLEQRITLGDATTGGSSQVSDRTVLMGLNRVFHLHCLENNDRIAF